MAQSEIGQGLIARATAALRYTITGTMPDGWFPPGTPLPTQAPEDVKGRQFDYPVFSNINYRPRGSEPVSFENLKQLATHPIVAMLIQRQIDKVCEIDWQIKPRKGQPAGKADDPEIGTLTDFFMMPDKEHDWVQWIGAVLRQHLVIDAVSIYRAPTRNGSVYALQVLDGAAFKPILDYGGRRPLAPLPAYQQTLKGLPAVDYTADELIYFPQVYRADGIYGYSKVEQAKDLIETAISRLRSQKGYFDYGNLGDGYFTAPDTWTPDMVKGLENQWNAMMQGDPAVRRSVPFLPHGAMWNATKIELLADQFDEFLIRLLCFPFGVAPQPFMKQTGLGHGSAGTDHEAAEEGGLAPLMQYISRLMNMIIAKWFGRADLEFAFVENREFDPQIAAKIDDMRVKNGTATVNEVRDRNGEPPLENGDKPLIVAGSTVMLLDDAVKPAPDPADIPAQTPPSNTGAIVAEVAAPPDDNVAKMTKAADKGRVSHIAVVLRGYLAKKGAEIAEIVSKAMFKAAPSDDYSGRIDDAFDEVDWDWSDLLPLVEPAIAGIAVTAGTDALSTLGLFDPETLKLVSARATDYAQARGAEMVGMKYVDGELVENPDAAWSIPDATRNMLRRAITDAMAEGQSNDQLAKTIQESNAFSADRADTIARTETAIADIRGAAAGWIESGVVGGAQFDASPDCCEECQAEDGTIVPLASPDDIDLIHPNCRCSWSAVLSDDMPDTLNNNGQDEGENED